MTETFQLAVEGACDGRVLATGCSGLAIISRFPFTQVTPLLFSGMYHVISPNVFLQLNRDFLELTNSLVFGFWISFICAIPV
jgi:hypothetical protein